MTQRHHESADPCSTWRESISALLDGETAVHGADEVEAHQDHCEGCSSFALDAARLHRNVRIRPAQPTPNFTAAVLEATRLDAALTDAALIDAALIDFGTTSDSSWSRTAKLRVAVCAAAVLAIIAGVGIWTQRTPASGEAEFAHASAYATLSPDGQAAEVYVSLSNTGGADVLVAASSPAAQSALLHRSEPKDGYVVMEHAEGYTVPERSSMAFSPGGAHIMLEGLAGQLTAGDRVPVTLVFERSADLTIEATVVAAGLDAGASASSAHVHTTD